MPLRRAKPAPRANEGTVDTTVSEPKMPANENMCDSCATPEEGATAAPGASDDGFGGPSRRASEVERRRDSIGRMEAVSAPKRANDALKHGGQSKVAIAPSVRGVKRELCRRLGVRYADLDAAGREAVDLYSRARAKLAAVDRWFEENPVVNESGEPAACLLDGGLSCCRVGHETSLCGCGHRLVRDHVGDDQGRREENEAEEEVSEEAMALSRGDTRRPECDGDPDRDPDNRPEPPSVCGETHYVTSAQCDDCRRLVVADKGERRESFGRPPRAQGFRHWRAIATRRRSSGEMR